jgi:hypothetical protein
MPWNITVKTPIDAVMNITKENRDRRFWRDSLSDKRYAN